MPSPIKYKREQRFRWYLQVDKYNQTVTDVSNISGISWKTYYKWKERNKKVLLELLLIRLYCGYINLISSNPPSPRNLKKLVSTISLLGSKYFN